MRYEEIISRFVIKKRSGNSAQAICPCHDDRNASLTITDTGESTLMMCHAGCSTRDILQRVGLNMADLYVNPKAKKQPDSDIIYNYGEYVKIRKPGKRIAYGRMVDGKFEPGIEGIKKVLYKQGNIGKARIKDKPIFICEGEKDSNTLSRLGFYSTTAGGCSDWKKEFAPLFKGMKVVLLPDNDEAGIRLMQRIEKDLKPYAFAIKVCMTSQVEKGDITDYIEEGHSVSDFKELVRSAEYEYADFVCCDSKPYVNPNLLAEHILMMENIIIVHTDGSDMFEYYGYDGGVYKRMSKPEIKRIIKEYIAASYATSSLLENIYNLMSASKNKCFGYKDLNSDPYIINLRDGLYHVMKEELMPHTPKYLSTFQLNCSYDFKGREPETFLKYLDDFTKSDDDERSREKLTLLCEWLALLISNLDVSETKKALFLYSPIGNTGKSVFLRIISDLLGIENVTNIPLQNISDRFAMADLYGKRVNIVGDQSSDDIEESSGFKQITGGDALKIEFKGKTGFSWTFRGGMVAACNALPYFADDKGGHIFDRMCIVPCTNTISEENRDTQLSNKLRSELSGIFRFVVKFLKPLIERDYRFTHCRDSEDCMMEYRQNIDSFYRFITENYELTFDSKDRIKKAELDDEYFMWYSSNYNGNVNKRKIREKAERVGIVCTKYYGIFCYKGIKKIDFIEDNNPENTIPEEFLS